MSLVGYPACLQVLHINGRHVPRDTDLTICRLTIWVFLPWLVIPVVCSCNRVANRSTENLSHLNLQPCHCFPTNSGWLPAAWPSQPACHWGVMETACITNTIYMELTCLDTKISYRMEPMCSFCCHDITDNLFFWYGWQSIWPHAHMKNIIHLMWCHS